MGFERIYLVSVMCIRNEGEKWHLHSTRYRVVIFDRGEVYEMEEDEVGICTLYHSNGKGLSRSAYINTRSIRYQSFQGIP